MQRGTFAVNSVLGEAVEGGDGHQQGSELGMIYDVEVEFFLADFSRHRKVQRNHRRRSAELAGDRGEMVAGNRADGAGYVDDFGGGQFRGKRGEHAAARHGDLNVAEAEERMATEEYAVGLHGGDGAGGVDRSVALNEDHAGHVAGNPMRIFRARRGGAALRGDETNRLDLRRELLQRGGLKTGEDERRFNRRESGARRESESGRIFL